MKNLTVFSALFFIVSISKAQIPQGFNYQAVVRDDGGSILADTEIDLRFTIYRTVFQQNPVVDYRETQSAATNEFGLINVVIGQGTPDMGSWQAITWIQFSGFTDAYLRVEMDFGNGWLELSDEHLQSVPYAEYADFAGFLIDGAWSPAGNYDTDENSFLGTAHDAPLVFKTANSERLRMEGNGEIIFAVSNEIPEVVFHNAGENSLESNLRLTTSATDEGGRLVYNPFGLGLLNEGGGPVVLQNNNASFTLNTSGNAILQPAGMGTETRIVVREGTDTDVAVGNSGFVLLGYTNGANVSMDTNEIMARNNGEASELYLNAQGGGVVINSFTTTAHSLYCNGTAAKPGGGSWTATSDARLKDNVEPYEAGLEEVMQIDPVTYHYKTETGHDATVEHVGVIAQDLQKISPEMVKEMELELLNGEKGNYLTVDPSDFTYMLINAVQQLNAQNAELKKRIERLELHIMQSSAE